MQALVRGSCHYGAHVEFNHIDDELSELGKCSSLQPLRRQRLLQIIHSTRALDTCLSTILRSSGVAPAHGIGKMLHQLKALPPHVRGYLDHATATSFSSAIAHKRNVYAHRAGSFPTSSQEVDQLVSDVHACLTIIL